MIWNDDTPLKVKTSRWIVDKLVTNHCQSLVLKGNKIQCRATRQTQGKLGLCH